MAGTRDALDSLAPWDAIPYFEQVREQSVTLQAGVTTQIIGADPNRVALVMTGGAVGTLRVSIDPNTDGTAGIPISQTIPAVQLRFAESGPLCQQAWYAHGMGGEVITYYAITLARWPRARVNNGRARRAPNA